MSHRHPRRLSLVAFGIALVIASSATAQSPTPPPTPPEPPYRAHCGPGVATSMFGTYIRGGELLVYPFVEHYRDRNFEYKPSEFGFAGDLDHRGRYRASEALFFLAYGLTDDLAIELEGAVVRASLDKAASDRSAVPARIAESAWVTSRASYAGAGSVRPPPDPKRSATSRRCRRAIVTSC